MKLHQKLGKPIPEIKTPQQLNKEEKSAAGKASTSSVKTVTKSVTPKISFVGGTKLVSTGSGTEQKEVGQTPDESMEASSTDDKDDFVGNDNEIIGNSLDTFSSFYACFSHFLLHDKK